MFRGKLEEWFNEMFEYASESDAARKVVEDLIGDTGPFANGEMLLSLKGSKFFHALSAASPQTAVYRLKHTLGEWDQDKLLNFTEGRQYIVWALERIAMWEDCFGDAARLLLKLAEFENEPRYGNNSQGTFFKLFSLGRDKFATSQAAPLDRIEVIEEALASDSHTRHLLAIKACGNAIKPQHSRMIGPEYQGLREVPNRWTPKTWGEVFDAYRAYWNLLEHCTTMEDETEQKEAIVALISNARQLVYSFGGNLGGMVRDTLKNIVRNFQERKQAVVKQLSIIIHYDIEHLEKEERQKWLHLKDEIIGGTFRDRIEHYVKMNILEDEYDDEGKRLDSFDKRINELVEEIKADKQLLFNELNWLITNDAERGYQFGLAIGNMDSDNKFLDSILNVQETAKESISLRFLSGYLRSINIREKEKWHSILDSFIHHPKRVAWISEITWSSSDGPIDDRAAKRVIELAENNKIETRNLMMFAFGSVFINVSISVFRRWIEFFLKHSSVENIESALALSNHYLLHEPGNPKKIPKNEIKKLLTNKYLVGKNILTDSMSDSYWEWLAKAFIKQYPDDEIKIARFILKHMGDENEFFDGIVSQTREVLNGITERNPKEIWDVASKYIEFPVDKRGYLITRWLRGEGFYTNKEQGAMKYIPPDLIWKWVDEDVKERAWYLATFVPNVFFHEDEKVCYAEELLARYGNDVKVRRNLSANFSSEGWSGSASAHYESKRNHLLKFLKIETNRNVKSWIKEYTDALASYAEQERTAEEREF